MPVKCLVLGCGSRRERDDVKFYAVPTVLNHKYSTNLNDLSKERRLKWLAAIKRDDLTQSKLRNQKVCSKHFITGKPSKLDDVNHLDWAPSQNMGHEGQATLKRKSDLLRKERSDKRQKTKSQQLKEPTGELNLEETGTSTQTDLTLTDLSALVSQQEFPVEKMKKMESKLEKSYFGLMDNLKDSKNGIITLP